MTGQSHKHSVAEAVFSNIIAFGISYGINLLVLPWFRRELTDGEAALWLTLLFSVVSIVRGYLVRRLFNWLHIRQARPIVNLSETDKLMIQEAERVGPLIGESLRRRSPFVDYAGLPRFPRFSVCSTCGAEAIQEEEEGPWLCLNPECQTGMTYHGRA